MPRVGGRQRSPLGDRSEEESELFVQALARGLTILALFDVEHPEWGLNDICDRTGISKTTASLSSTPSRSVITWDRP
jgi:hypothetical protein